MISKEELLNLLSLPEGSDLSAVREKVRSLENRALDAVAAQAVCDWTGVRICEPFGLWGIDPIMPKLRNQVPLYTKSLDAAAALMPKIEEMGLKCEWAEQLEMTVFGEYLDGMITTLETRDIANATARQRTEAAVLAVAGRCFQ